MGRYPPLLCGGCIRPHCGRPPRHSIVLFQLDEQRVYCKVLVLRGPIPSSLCHYTKHHGQSRYTKTRAYFPEGQNILYTRHHHVQNEDIFGWHVLSETPPEDRYCIVNNTWQRQVE